MASVVRGWEARFERTHPGARFENHLIGTDTAMPALYNGLADLSLFGRESNQTEDDGFLHTLQYKPLQMRLMQGSLSADNKSYAPVVFVAKANTLASLTLAQLRAVFGWGGAKPAATWGDLGLAGPWKDRPIHAYAIDLETGTGAFFLRRLQGPSRKMNWRLLREFRDLERPDGSVYFAGQQTVDALRRDPDGIAVSGLQYATEDVKPLALSASDEPPILASRETVQDGRYPFARATYIFLNRRPGEPVSPLLVEFLRFVYSDEGQRMVTEAGFIPLSHQVAAAQLQQLQ